MTSQTSTATNLTGPNANAATSNGPQYFNNLYSSKFIISANANDAIVAFFEQYADNKQAGDNLAAAVTYTALAQQLDPMTVLTEFQKMPKGQLNNYLIAFLNSTRVPTSVLGVKTQTTTSPFVTRTILS
jgi:hypothetical protein